ncbi:fatty acid desaturase family protein [Larkinella terrae]|uniref:Acyl-CoA desaturase n=1 Tax=Larkinella terrae TaxID=2025311 RepID=A0A7K0EJP8_9BACT|nr:acyl-CoA desaturase [Larkinella terrae]MRS61658.1 acyl-CoA desaturase [Larkinella terrae]
MQLVKFSNRDKSQFFSVLRGRVEIYFKQGAISKQGDKSLIGKGIFMLTLLLLPYSLILSYQFSPWACLGLAVVMGLGTAGVGMAVMHDANHGSFSSHPWVNALFSSSLYLLRGNVLNWKVQHNTLHHTYTNIHEVDEDITGKFLLRLSWGDPYWKIHRYQHIYAFFLYGLMTLSFLVKDFRQAYKYNHRTENKLVKPFSNYDIGLLITSKLIYVLFIVGLPLAITKLTFGQWLIGFLVMHFIAGLVLSTIFQLAHLVEGAEQPAPDQNGLITNAWAIHQLQTTADFSSPRIVSWFIGGLDFQVEHHLFPTISHIHYRALSSIVQRTAEEYAIPYNRKESFFKAIASHIRMLKRLGN